MAIKPEEIDPSKLPVALRGYDRAATDELLKRVAWDYRQMVRAQESWEDEGGRLRQRIDELETQVASQTEDFAKAVSAHESRADSGASVKLHAENSELFAKNEKLRAEVERLTAEGGRLAAEVERLRSQDSENNEREELTRTLLKTAQRVAHEIRDKAKAEAEAVLAEAHGRAEQIEAGAKEGVRNSSDEVARLRRLEEDLRIRLQQTLEAVLGKNGANPEGQPEAHGPEPEHWPTASVD
jgi:cell division septum initiation protein DivIVA